MGGGVSPQSESGESRELTGSGAPTDPYQIATANDLREFAQRVNNGQIRADADAILTADIDLNPGMEINDDGTVTGNPEEWTPIGNSSSNSYEGTFNGAGHTIKGLYINDSTADYRGLFGFVGTGGTVQNLSVSGSVKGDDYVGGVVGQNRGSVENCYNTGAVNSSGNRVGGVVGYNSRIVKNCYNTGAVNSSGNWVGGVVGVNSGSVTNCYNTGNISGNISDNHVGGVVGYNNGGTVENCYNTGKVSGPDSGNISGYSYVGGVVGLNRGTVENCYNTGTVSSNSNTSDVGGVVGCNGGTVTNRGTVENCYNTGTVTGSSNYVGGVVGYNIIGGSVTNCYNIGTVTGTDDYVGGVVGYNYGGVTNCYFLQGTAGSGIGSGKPSEENVKSLTAEEFAIQSSFTNSSWDFTSTWEIESIFGRPTLKANAEIGGTANNPYKIFTATQLKNFATAVNGDDTDAHAKLMNDIDLNPGITFNADGTYFSPAGVAPQEWTPIGTSSSKPYSGTFDGNGHTISGLYINSSSDNYQGLFGRVGTGGTVKDLSVSGSVSGSEDVGGVVGSNGGSVTNCYNTGKVSGSIWVGGVVGNNGGNVENCYNTGTVTGGAGVGGVVGGNSGTVKNCYNIGSVTATGIDGRVGGVVGWNDSGANVENCYNTGTVTGTDDYVGGVVGYNGSGYDDIPDGIVANCYYQIDKGATVGIGGTIKDDISQTAAKSLEDFHSGEVAWRLQDGQAEDQITPVWGQNLMKEPKDNYPQLRAFDADTPQVYKVAFMNDSEEHDAKYANNGMTVGSPTTNPTKEGYTFAGWFTKSSGGSQWNFNDPVNKSMTLYAQWTAVEEPDPDPEPTPEPEPEEPPYSGKYSYEVFTSVGDNGTISVDRYATEGDKVTIDVTPDQAYKLDDLSVTANGKDVELTANSDGTYSFTMPSADVRITATFAEDPDWTEPEEPATDVSDLFIDIAPNAWYKDAVQYAYDNGLMTGVSATEFAPEATTTRAMIVSILARLEGVTTAQAAGFADVTDEWYATAVNWAAGAGVVNGYEDNTFQPNTAITREQLAAILRNYAAYKGEDVSTNGSLANYSDAASISTWAEDSMQWAVGENLISGVTNDTLAPQAHATRAQVAAIFQRFLSE